MFFSLFFSSFSASFFSSFQALFSSLFSLFFCAGLCSVRLFVWHIPFLLHRGPDLWQSSVTRISFRMVGSLASSTDDRSKKSKCSKTRRKFKGQIFDRALKKTHAQTVHRPSHFPIWSPKATLLKCIHLSIIRDLFCRILINPYVVGKFSIISYRKGRSQL